MYHFSILPAMREVIVCGLLPGLSVLTFPSEEMVWGPRHEQHHKARSKKRHQQVLNYFGIRPRVNGVHTYESGGFVPC